MLSNILSTATVVLAATQLVSAQTSTKCNPMEKKCPDDPALGKTVTVDFTKGENDFFEAADGTKINYDGQGAAFIINKETDAPTITSTKYIFFGKIDVEVQASTGTGVVTSFVLQSDDLDEIDWEWLGGDETQVQTNYFGKGDTTTYDRGAYHQVASPQTQTHKYTVEWTKDHVVWSIDGSQVRELKYSDAKDGTRFPQTPMQIKLGTWVAGGKDSPKGTVEWAGGYTDFSQAPFTAYYKSVTIEDYGNGKTGAEKYVWGDKSDGSYQSIQVVMGDGDDDSETSSSATSTQESTKTSDATSTTKSDASKTTLSTSTTGTSSASSSSTESASGSASETPAPTSENNGDAEAGSDPSGAAPTETSIPTTGAAFKNSFSGAAFGACLLAAFLL
ncbi:glycoside hydrolase family 16 protein [Hypoxylon sp. FL1284]|nr:glycoside hydrolase family 16 protein [Hypoxylon sp. FL1284]